MFSQENRHIRKLYFPCLFSSDQGSRLCNIVQAIAILRQKDLCKQLIFPLIALFIKYQICVLSSRRIYYCLFYPLRIHFPGTMRKLPFLNQWSRRLLSSLFSDVFVGLSLNFCPILNVTF